MPEWSLEVIRVVLLAGMLVGWLGMVIPFFPGITVIWLAALFYGVIVGFGNCGGCYFIALTLLAIVGWLADNILMVQFARKGDEEGEKGASWGAIIAAMVAGIVGSLLLSPLGGIAATLGALFVVEYLRQRDARRAWQRMWRMALGWGWAIAVRMGIGLLMIALWAVWAW